MSVSEPGPCPFGSQGLLRRQRLSSVVQGILIVSLVFLACGTARAQVIPAETFEDPRLPEVVHRPGVAVLPAGWESAEVGEIEFARFTPPPPVFSIGTVQSLYYNDNVLFRRDHPVGSMVWEGRFGAALVPHSTARWTPSLSGEHLLVRHDRVSSADYNGQALSLGSSLRLDEQRNWTWNAGYVLRRYYAERPDHGEIYKYGAIANELVWVKALSRETPLSAVISYQLAWRHASPGHLDRLDNGAYVGLAYAPIRQVTLQPFVIPMLRTYTNPWPQDSSRHDFNLRAGLAMTWHPSANLALTASLVWWRNYSSTALREYEATLPGLSLAAGLGF